MNEPQGHNSQRQADINQWAMFLHLSQFAGYLIPLAGMLAPIIIWIMKKDDMPELDPHGKAVINWIISAFIYFVISGVLSVVLIGIPLLIILSVLAIVFPIVGAIKANGGEVWDYPMSIRFLR